MGTGSGQRERADLLLLCARRPSAATLAETMSVPRVSGRQVRLAGLFDVAPLRSDARLTEARSLLETAEGQGPEFRRRLVDATGPERLWWHVLADPWLRLRWLAGDEVLGLDAAAVEIAGRLKGSGSAGPPWSWTSVPPEQRPKVGRLLLRALRRDATATTAALPERGRAGRAVPETARELALTLLDAGRRRAAARIIDAAAPLVRSPRARADLWGDFAGAELGRGLSPSRLRQTVRSELDLADSHLRLGELDRAARGLAEAASVAFHRAVHFDRTDSPLAVDPIAFSAPFRASNTAAAARRTEGRANRAGHNSSTGVHKIVLATHGNQNFLGPIRDRLRADPHCEIREIDLSGAVDLKGKLNPPMLVAAALGSNDPVRIVIESLLRPTLDWADTVFVDWCTAFAVMVTMVDPGDARVVLRLHSYEAFSWWPHLVDFTRVDDVVFVSEHLRDLAVAAVPGLQDASVRRHVLPIGTDTASYARPKTAAAPFTLGLVGYAQIAKDPRWALEVLRLLRAGDDRFRLLLIGADLETRASAAARQYLERFRSELRELEGDGAVERLGQTDDVPGALTRVGFILSTSVRESFHLGLMEGAASGAVPVVRNWPMFADRPSGAHTLFPPGWLVETPPAAAERILAVSRDADEWRRRGGEAAQYVRGRWDTAVVAPMIDQLFRPDHDRRADDRQPLPDRTEGSVP